MGGVREKYIKTALDDEKKTYLSWPQFENYLPFCLWNQVPKPWGVQTHTKIELRDFDYFALKEHCAWLDAVPFFPIFETLLFTLYNLKVLLTDDFLQIFYSLFE